MTMRTLILLLCSLAVSGCYTQKEYDALKAERDALELIAANA